MFKFNLFSWLFTCLGLIGIKILSEETYLDDYYGVPLMLIGTYVVESGLFGDYLGDLAQILFLAGVTLFCGSSRIGTLYAVDRMTYMFITIYKLVGKVRTGRPGEIKVYQVLIFLFVAGLKAFVLISLIYYSHKFEELSDLLRRQLLFAILGSTLVSLTR